MSVECVCINDAGRPKEIPINKWVKKGNAYTVIFTVTVLPQKAFTEENLKKLIELIKDCSDITFSMDELLKQTELTEV